MKKMAVASQMSQMKTPHGSKGPALNAYVPIKATVPKATTFDGVSHPKGRKR
jgi:hypothetical protein